MLLSTVKPRAEMLFASTGRVCSMIIPKCSFALRCEILRAIQTTSFDFPHCSPESVGFIEYLRLSIDSCPSPSWHLSSVVISRCRQKVCQTLLVMLEFLDNTKACQTTPKCPVPCQRHQLVSCLRSRICRIGSPCHAATSALSVSNSDLSSQ